MQKKLRFNLWLLIGLMLMTVGSGNAFATEWEKATSIAVGDVVLLTVDNGTVTKELTGISTTSTKYGTVADYTGTPAGTYPLTVVAGSAEGSFAFQAPETDYLYWQSGNSLSTSLSIGDDSSWTVSFDGTTATITNVGTTSRTLQYNAGQPRFACYASNQTPVTLWKQVAEEPGGGQETPAVGEKVFYYWNGYSAANSITLTDGATLAITGNTEKTLTSASNIKVNGTQYTSFKLSNGAQNTLTLPEGTKAVGITFWSYINSDSGTAYWKEVAGTNYGADTEGGMGSYKEGANPDMRHFTFDATNVITFTNSGKQLCFVFEVEYAAESSEPEPEPEPQPELPTKEVALKSGMFYNWNGYGADAEKTTPAGVEFNLGTELSDGGVVCGTSTVDYLIYADLTGCKKMIFEGTDGLTLRVLMNRQESNSGPLVEKQATISEGVAELDLTDMEYIHLNAIKLAYKGVSGSVNAIKLVKPYDPNEPVEYLLNADFAAMDAWTAVYSASFKDYGSGLIGTYQVRGEFNAATVDETHLATEYCIGVEARWSNSFAAFTQTTEEALPAGKYALTYDVMNVNGSTTAANYENRFTVTVGETVYTDQATEWMQGGTGWTRHTINFTLTEESPITVSLGYGTGENNLPWQNTPALYISHLQLTDLLTANRATLQAEIDAAELLLADASYTEGRTEFETAINTAKDALALTDADEVLAAVEPLKQAKEAFYEANIPIEPGIYYVYNPLTDKFLSRGSSWGTRAIVDNYGLPINFTQVAQGVYTLQEFDNELYYGDSYWMYADCSGDRVRQFKAEKTANGTFYLRNQGLGAPNNRMYVYLNDGDDKFAVAGNGTPGDNVSDEAQTEWQLFTAEEYRAFIAQRSAAEKDAAAVAAGFQAGMEFLPDGDATTLTFKTGSNWQFTKTKADGWEPTVTHEGTELFIGAGKFTQTVSGVPAGLYKVSIQAFFRNRQNSIVAAKYDQGYEMSSVYLVANGNSIHVKSWAADRTDNVEPNSMGASAAAFAAGKYLSEGYAYVGQDGNLELTVSVPSYYRKSNNDWSDACWFMADNVTFVKVNDAELIAARNNLLAGIAEANLLLTEDFFENGQADLTAAVATAQGFTNSEDKTQLEEAAATLQAAMTAFYNANNPETGKYYLKNVGNGMFWGAGNSWGTQASLVEHPEYVTLHKQDNGTYHMESLVSNGGTAYFFEGDFMDNGNPKPLTLKKVAANTWTIANGTELYGFDGQSTVLGKNVAEGTNAQWLVLTDADMLATLDGASFDAPADATFFVLDQNFGRNNRNAGAWQVVSGSNVNLSGGNNVNNNAEVYMSAFEIKQAIEGLPAGVYQIDAQAAVTFHDNRTIKGYDGNGYPVIFANDEETNFNEMVADDQLKSMSLLSEKFTAGNYRVEPITVIVTDGQLNVGIKSHRADIWAVWDNIVLTYKGCNAADLQGLYQPWIDRGNAVKDEYMNTEVKSALNNALAYNVDFTDMADFKAAFETLQQAVLDAEANVASYAPVKAKLTEIDKVLAYTNVYTTEAYVAFKAQHEAYRAAYKDGSLTTEQAQTLVNDVLPIGAWHKANTIDDLLLSTWSVGDVKAKDYDTSLYINTWSTEGNIDGSEFKAPFFEYWVSDANTLGANILHADMDELDPGVYDVKARVRVRLTNGQTELSGIKMQLNDGDEVDFAGTQIGTSPLYLDNELTAQGIVGKDGKLCVKFIVEEGNTASWLAFKDVMVSLNGMETDALQQQLAIEAAKKDLQQLVDEGEELYEDCGIYTAATSKALREALDNAIDGIALDDITVRQLNQLKKQLRAAINALDLREQSYADFAILEGDIYASGQEVEIVASDDENDVAMTITFGVEGGDDFYAGVADSSVDGFVAFTEGNGTNGTANSGTVYYLEPQYDGVVTMGIALDKNKRLFIREGSEGNKEAFNGQTLDEKFAGAIVFNVKGGTRYTIWAASSKLGFYGLNYEFGDGVEPVDEVNPGIATRISGVSTDRLNGTVYTISGQKVDNTRNMKKGVYVVNGKKVMF